MVSAAIAHSKDSKSSAVRITPPIAAFGFDLLLDVLDLGPDLREAIPRLLWGLLWMSPLAGFALGHGRSPCDGSVGKRRLSAGVWEKRNPAPRHRFFRIAPFHDILDAEMVNAALASAGVTFKERISTPFVTLCMFLSQVLDPDHSCRAAVARLIVWLAVNHHKPCSPETNSYCDARQRLPLEVIVELVHQTAHKIEAGASDQWLWKGRRTSLIDGSTSSMPDTPENQRAFPQANTHGIGLGFPVLRYVALISLATGVVRDLALGPYKGKETGETALFRTLLDRLESGEIVLVDRCFASYFMIAELLQRGVDGLFRMHQRRKFDFRGGRQLGFEDHVVTWTKPERPEWMDEETYAQMPNKMEIRELRFKVQQPGFRVNELVLVTTMLDAEEYTKEELAELFLQRWNIELDLRSIKAVLQMDVLRCKTPEMVEK